jgi:hypothetical protein
MTAVDDPEKDGSARYAFAVRFRLDASTAEWRADSRPVERTCYREASPPGEPGWLFFRDHLWRGECNHSEHLARVVGEAFSLPVERVEFRGLRTDEAYFTALKEEIAADLALFNADSTAEVINKYLGSSIQVGERSRE